MKAVILAAGRGKRMGSLTDDKPKPLLLHKGKELIKHTLDVIPTSCKEILIVVGYYGDQIKDSVGVSWNNIPVTYITQTELNGTGGALWLARKYLDNHSFLVFPADDIYEIADVEKIINTVPSMMVAQISNGRVSGGKVHINETGKLIDIVEGSHESPLHVATAVYHLTHHIFEYPLELIPGRSEYGLPQTVVQYTKDFPVHIISATKWRQMVGPEDLGK